MRLACLLALLTSLFALEARAQACASCTPLALPSAVTQPGGVSLGSYEWVLVGQVSAGWLGFPSQTAAGQRFDDPNRARIDLGLSSLDVSAQHRSGFGASLQLPAALIAAADVTGQRIDPGLGDLDLRARFLGQPASRVVLGLNAGVVLPTGRYSPRSGALALSAAAQALTPGRGTSWAAVEGQARWSVIDRLTLGLSVEGRWPVADAPDGFRWGPELRSAIDAQVRVGELVFFGLGLETQWRGTSSVEDPFLGARVDSGSTGGVVLAALPGVTVRLPAGVFVQASARVPLYQALSGLQFNQGVGVFAGVGVTLPVGLSRAEASRVTGGGWAVVDYDAEWCQACRELRPVIEAAKTEYPSVAFTRVDVTRWSQEELEQAVPGSTGLPIVEIRNPQGRVVARLEGDSARQILSTLKKELP